MSKTSTNLRHLALICSGALGLAPVAPPAESGGGAANGGRTDGGKPAADGEGVIIIQATKRAEDIQQVPISVIAYTSEDVRDSTDTTLSDLWQHTANVTQFNDHRNGQLSIRGVGYGEQSPFGGEEKPTRGLSSPIGFYVDGVSLETMRGMSDFGSLYDVDTVELLRGPQGTLYGRNALGGVVNVRSKDPTTVNEIDGSIYGGSYHDYRIDAAGGGPLSDVVGFRVAAEQAGGDGYNKNITTGDDKTDQYNDFNARAKVQWKASDQLTVKATVAVASLKDSTDKWVPFANIDNRETTTNNPGEDKGKGVVAAVQADYQVDKDLTATLIAGLGIADDKVAYDADRTANDTANQTGQTDTQSISLEGRLARHGDGPLNWLAGFYAMQEKLDYTAHTHFSDAPQAFAGGMPYYNVIGQPEDLNYQSSTTTQNLALFGEATYDVDAHWSVTGGLRVAYEHEAFDWANQLTNVPAGPGGPIVAPSLAFTDTESSHEAVLLPKAVVAYHVDKDLMTYASVTRGYRSGGFNTTADAQSTAQMSFDPEYTWNYELGAKSEWYDHKMTVNASVFYIDWRNQQVQAQPQPFEFAIVNAAHAHVIGGELEGSLRPLAGLRLWGSFGVLHAEWNERTDPFNGTDYSGKQFPNIPHFTAAAGATYSADFGGFVGVSLYGQSATFVDDLNTQAVDHYLLFDAKVGYSGRGWSIAFIGRNLFDKSYVLQSMSLPGDGGITAGPATYVRLGPPRTIGLELGAWW